MPRPGRIDFDGALHHVYTRGTKRWTIFLDDDDRWRFLALLARTNRRYGLRVYAYCLMDNHFHLVVQCPHAQLSDAMRDLKSQYARWFNERHVSSGPIFEDRFGSVVIASDLQLHQTVRYVHRNPYAVDARLDLTTYRWSSYRSYLGADEPPAWLIRQRLSSSAAEYRQYVEAPMSGDKVQNIRGVSNEEVPGTSSLALQRSVGIADIMVAVAHAAAVSLSEVHPSHRNGLAALAVLIARSEAGLSVNEIYEPLGYRTPKAVYSAFDRAKRRCSSDPVHFETVERAKATLWPAAA